MNKVKSYLGLEDKTILVTGSSRGIGEVTARLAKEYGAKVILHGKTESDRLKYLSKELKSPYIFCDSSNRNYVTEEINKVGSIDVLVNNAGINPSKKFMDLEEKDWQDIFGVNLFGVVNFSRAVIPRMLSRGYGKIINVSSVKGYNYVVGKPAYASSKAAVMRLTSSMAEEFAPNILVNAVAPGFTNTEMTEKTIIPKIRNQIDNIPLKRMAESRDIAEVILFLASDKSDYITGQTIAVDGGFSIISGK